MVIPSNHFGRESMQRAQTLRRALIKAIEEFQVDAEMSERALSAKLGQHKNYINEILHGQHVVKFEEFVLIAEGLGKSPHDLLGRVLTLTRFSEKFPRG